MKQDIFEVAGIETINEQPTINGELETRKLTRCKINRSLDNLNGGNNYSVFEGFTLETLKHMKQENEHFISKLLTLKINLSPFKNIVPKQLDCFQVGAILTDSWGWEQTNIDFYCIVKRSGQWVTVLPMTKHTSEEKGFMTNDEMPYKIDFSADPQRKKLSTYNGKESGFSFRKYSGGGWCRLWDGQAETSTHYA